MPYDPLNPQHTPPGHVHLPGQSVPVPPGHDQPHGRPTTPFDPGLAHHATCECIACIDKASHARPGIHTFPDRLYVVTMLDNPLRWRSRYHNYAAFEAMVHAAGAILYTAEIAFGERHHEITSRHNPRHVQFRTTYEVWQKERALNLLIGRLPPEAKYVAWIDADVTFVRPDWAQETLHLLQHYDFIQMFSHAQDVGPDFEPATWTPGFVYAYHNQQPAPHHPDFGKGWPRGHHCYYDKKIHGTLGYHPGFAWAARRSALDKVGGLIDWAILGSGDWHMCSALFGEVERSLYVGYTKRYLDLCYQWQDRAEKHIRRNVGYMPGLVNHYFHGNKADRQYNKRWKFLAQSKYDPDLDIKRDWQGLHQLTERNRQLRDGIRAYARARQEDTTL